MPKTDSEILSAIDAKAKESYGYSAGTLAAEREQAINYYLGKPYGNEVDGRSQVVTRDVLETVEWILPSLLKTFVSGDKVVEFVPQHAEDVEAAEQETEYVNHVCMKQNDSFLTLYSWFKDALLLKTGYVKVYWDESEDVTEESYENLSQPELMMLMQDQAVEIVAAEQVNDLAPDGSVLMLFNVTLKRTNKTGKVCIDAIPTEELLVDMGCRGLDLGKSDYVEHRTRKTLSDIRLMGFDVSEADIYSESDGDDDPVALARNIYDEEDDVEGADESTEKVWFRDVTIRVDEDGDGIAELMRYYIVGKTILWRGKAENVYYAALGAIPMPHRHVGLSVADLVMDLQFIRSTILRQYLDGLYLANNGRYAISDMVNLDDMLTSRPGGVVRVNGMPGEGHILPMVHPSTGASAIEGLNYLDSQKETRTGVSKNEQGMDADQLHKTASGQNMIMTAAMQRRELIARIFAETGVKRLYTLVHELTKKHQDKQTMFRLRNKWIPVDPRQWKTRTDMTISVGLGTGNKDSQLAHLATIMQVQEKGMAIGITDPKKIYHAAKRLAENAGFSDGDEFFTDPSTQPPKPPQPPIELQIKQMELAALEKQSLRNHEQKLQEIRANYELQASNDARDAEKNAQKAALDAELERQKIEFDIWREKLAAETKILVAQIGKQVIPGAEAPLGAVDAGYEGLLSE